MDVEIILIEDIKDAPKELLLLADPSWENVLNYLTRGQCYAPIYRNEVVGVLVLLKTREVTFEIMNIAIRQEYQRRGIGKKLILHAIDRASSKNAKTIEIGTGNSSIHQLMLYQKCGFRIVEIDKDFFTRHYKNKIYENGIQCRDMIRLSYNLCEG